eukprot:6463821-Amphidinium_carterae.1
MSRCLQELAMAWVHTRKDRREAASNAKSQQYWGERFDAAVSPRMHIIAQCLWPLKNRPKLAS